MNWTIKEMFEQQPLGDRTKYLGASDLHNIFNCKPYGCARRLYYDKVEPIELEQNFNMRRGHIFEKLALTLFEIKGVGKIISYQPELEKGFMKCHLDSIVEYNGRKMPLEIKCPNIYKKDDFLKNGVDSLDNMYLFQGLMQMYLSGYQEMIFGILFPDEPDELHLIPYKFDSETWEKILIKINEFWQMCQNKQEPLRLTSFNEKGDKRRVGCRYINRCWEKLANEIESKYEAIEQEENLEFFDILIKYKQLRSENKLKKEEFENCKAELKQKMIEKHQLKIKAGEIQEGEKVKINSAYYQLKTNLSYRWKDFIKENPESIIYFKVRKEVEPDVPSLLANYTKEQLDKFRVVSIKENFGVK